MKPPATVACIGALLALLALPLNAQLAAPASAPAPAPKETEKEMKPEPAAQPEPSDAATLVLSPFEVVADNRGYYGMNTMSGTRLNSSLEDISASLTVVTKQQMEDLALLDMNDIFNYEASTEGTGNYTEFSFNAGGVALDNSSTDPLNSNRIRGLGNANITFGNFETSGRTPIDPINVDSVEIGRGPNSNIFGIGSPAGSVNTVPATARLNKNRSTVAFRTDDRGGWRTSLDLNRVIKKDVLAIRGSIVEQHEGFTRKPAGVDSRRLNGMVRYAPFKGTTLNFGYSYYKAAGTRPNNLTPRDGVTPWINAGSPTWDPVTNTVKINGAVVGTFTGTLPSYFTAGSVNDVFAYVDQGGLQGLSSSVTTSSTTPLTASGGRRLVNTTADPTGYLATQPLITDTYPIVNKSIYDWDNINVAGLNRFEDKTETYTATFEQILLNSQRQLLALQLGWFREANERYNRQLVGTSTAIAGDIWMVQIDPNERLLDGSPNPYFGRPFINLNSQYTGYSPIDRDTYRAQLAYKLDLRREKNWWRWLGAQQMSAYYEYKDIGAQGRNRRDAIVSDHTWLANNLLRGSTTAVTPFSPAGRYARPIQRIYLGDSSGYNIDYGSTPIEFGTYSLRYGNQTSGFTNENVTLDQADGENNGGTLNSRTLLKSQGVILQSYLLKDRLVTTFGRRFDQRYSRAGMSPVFADDTHVDETVFNTLEGGEWLLGQGYTKSAGAVLKVFDWLSLRANWSDSFNPSRLQLNARLQPLPDPRGKTEDFGFTLKLLDDKLVVRATAYKTLAINARNASLVQRVTRLDFAWATSNGFALQRQATAWVTSANPGLGADAVNQRVADIMKVPVEYLINPEGSFSAVNDLESRGAELEIHYNPTSYWTMKLTGAKTEAIAAGVAADLTEWLEERLPVWLSIIDPTTGLRWWSTSYSPGGSAQTFYTSMVEAPLGLEQALQGKSRPQVRKYSANFTTNFRLSGVTQHNILKRFNVGGAVRWQDKGAIGFHGIPDSAGLYTSLDANRPIYDKARFYFDGFVGYRTPLFRDKVRATFQLNVRNLQEDGRLQAVQAGPDGKATAYRIVDPRTFILSASFDL